MAKYIAKPTKGARLNSADPLGKSLAGAWLLNEKGGLSKIADATYKNQPAAQSASGLTWSSADHGAVLVGDGTGSVDTGLTNTALGTPYSFACRFVITTSTGGGGDALPVVFSLGSNILIYTNATGGGTNLRWQHDAGGFEHCDCSAAINFNQWYDCVVTSTGSGAGNTKIYIDGLQADNAADAGALSSGNLNLFKQQTGSARTLVGRIAYVYAWSRVLSFREVQSLHADDPFRMFRRRWVPVPIAVTELGTEAFQGDAFQGDAFQIGWSAPVPADYVPYDIPHSPQHQAIIAM